MFETTLIPEQWVQRCNSMAAIWVPAAFNRRTFSDAGVDEAKIEVVPIGVDTSEFRPDALPLELGLGSAFRFLSVCAFSARKGWDILVQAFVEEFRPTEDVQLAIKASRADEGDCVAHLSACLDALQRQVGHRGPPVFVAGSRLPSALMPRVYASVNAFVLPSRGEGWGMPYAEAMASQLPTIGTRWSGNLDFMDDGNSYLIDVESLVPVDPAWAAYPTVDSRHRWAEPSREHLRHLMRAVYESPETAAAKAQRARRDMQKWTWGQIAPRVRAALERVAGGTATETRATQALPRCLGRCAPSGSPSPQDVTLRLRERAIVDHLDLRGLMAGLGGKEPCSERTGVSFIRA